MATVKKKVAFAETEEGIKAKELLEIMTASDQYNTQATYTANTKLYPDNLMTFTGKHMTILATHPSLAVHDYLSNLRLITRIR